VASNRDLKKEDPAAGFEKRRPSSARVGGRRSVVAVVATSARRPTTHLHCVHDMWLQPWFFSMRVWHLGQRRVLARIQFAVSDSF
jgi:hypothetical protein